VLRYLLVIKRAARVHYLAIMGVNDDSTCSGTGLVRLKGHMI